MQANLLYGLNDKPKPQLALTAAVQHILASFVGIITPTLVIGSVLGLETEIPYLLSMALLVSGVSTFVQVKRIGPLGSGVIAVQGTSFAFMGALITAGSIVKQRGGSSEEIIAMLVGICFAGAFIEIFVSQFISKLGRVINPVVTGVVITTIGISLIKVGMTDMAGGFGAANFGAPAYLLVGISVFLLIIVLNAMRNPWLRLSAILIGMLAGSLVGYGLGIFEPHTIPGLPLVSLPIPFKYGFDFDWQLFLPVAFIYLLTSIETSGDLTAVSHFCGLPLQGKEYLERIKGGVLADGFNSMVAAVFSTFPNTTFGQNNAVIQMTGVASRYVGFYVAGILALLGLFPIVGALLQLIPKPVLGGATLVMFGTVAVAGVSILSRERLDRRKTIIVASSLGLGLGSMMVPELLTQTPQLMQVIFSSSVAVAGLTAILLSLLLPEPGDASNVAKVEPADC
ncbi:nucleobase:cation symporter-2 family protein [Halioxenophilus sp. WMMB6]|uniref:uracil-xanthine permease family protein n=1 Tax=Halioxenophilus sp. WMMB6 TaxID=3073815 RepID=UPI00295E3ABA|nr:nucleobase:cation symporter-2 family protein [Halioxenophilus sp. WMMB6]